MKKTLGKGSISLLLVMLTLIWNCNLPILNGKCLGDIVLDYLGLPTWSIGTFRLHITIYWSLILLIPAFFIAIMNKKDLFAISGLWLSGLFCVGMVVFGLTVFALPAFATEREQIEPSWYEQYFSETESVFPSTDMTALEENIIHYNQSITQNGYTITLLSGISDGCRSFFNFMIEAPEGKVLDGDYSLNYAIKENFHHTDNADNPTHHSNTDKMSVSFASMSDLEDSDPSDSHIIMLCEYRTSDTSYSSGSIVISINKIIESPRGQADTSPNVICCGNWTFDIELPEAPQAIELLDSPKRCAARRCFRSWYFDIHVKVTSFQLRTFSATLLFDKPLTGYWEGINLKPIYLVMKDGTQIKANFKAGANCGDYMECIYEFDYPILHEDVAYVLFS